jgi:hypothetical protein
MADGIIFGVFGANNRNFETFTIEGAGRLLGCHFIDCYSYMSLVKQ